MDDVVKMDDVFFQFHATATAAAGTLKVPFHEQIEVAASSTLPPGGGYGSSRALHFRHRDILSIREAYSYVTGSETRNSFETATTSVVTGLNILDMVTADRIVARLTSSKSKDGSEASIIPLGSHFENLRIAGQSVPFADRLRTNLFANLDTLGKIVGDPGDDVHLAEQQHRLDQHLSDAKQRADPDERLSKYLRDGRNGRATRDLGPNGALSTSLIPNLQGAMDGFACTRQVVPVQQFGLVRLAELRISHGQRRLTMLAVNLGCPFEGSLDICYAESNGSIWGLDSP
jgi:hypothetical protein